MCRMLKQSTTITLRYGPFLDDTDFKTEETALSPTMEISKAGGAFAARNSATATAHDSNGWYSIEMNATDTNTLGGLTVKVDAAGHLPVWEHFMVVPANVWDSFFGADLLQVDATQWAGSATATTNVALKTTLAKTTDITGFNDLSAAQVNAEVDSALDTAVPGTPTAGSINERLKTMDDADIPARLPSALVSGRMDSSVGAMAAGVITAAAHAASSIDAAALATDAVNEIADGLLNRDMSTGTDSGSATVRTVRQALRALRNKASISAGTLTVTKEDDTTASWTGTVTTAAGDPISSIDPASA